MRALVTRLGRMVLFVVGLLYAQAGVAHAQSIEFTQMPAASSQATSSPVSVAYYGEYGQDGDCYGPDYCYAFYPYDNGFALGTLSTLLDGSSVYLAPSESENCTYSYHGLIFRCDQNGTATGTLSYGVGTHQLAVSVQRHDGTGDVPASYGFTVTAPPPPGVLAVTVNSGGTANVTGGALLQSATFTVQNVGSVDGTVFLAASCSGSAIPSGTCASWMREVFVAVGQSVPVRVDFANVAPGGTGTVTLSATDPATGATLSSASDAVYASASPRAIASVVPYSTRANFERSLCADFAIVPNVANQCGVVRLTHALPSVTTFGKTYTPVLAYYGDFTRGVDLGIDLQIPDAQPMPGVVTYNVYRLNDDGSPSDASAWRTFNIDWGTNIASRKGRATIIDLDFSSSPNRLHNLRVEVLFDGVAVANLNTQVATIYQYYSQRPTREWTLLGLEQIFPNQPGGAVLWVDGDGSTRAYRPQGGGVYLAQSLLGPDSLINDPNGQWHRVLPNHARVIFDALGRHIITQNRYGRQTVFNYADGTAASALQSITVPGGQSYTFTNSFAQTIVTAPGGRTVTMNHTPTGQGITSFIDPDGQKDSVEYLSGWGGDVVIGAYVDKRGTRTALTWDPCYHTLLLAETPIGSGQTHRLSFDSYNGAGGCGWVWNKADYIIDGARTDVNDESAFWVDSVGAVAQVRNPLLQVTTIEHGDPRFPALPTRVVHPNGFAQSTAYDARGHVASTTSWNPLGDGRNARTTYAWHPQWDVPITIRQPEGEVTRFGVDDASGDVLWTQIGDDAATRINYTYTSHLVQTVTTPASSYPTTLAYDAVGNDTSVTTPRGLRTRFVRDGIGRVYVSDSPTGDGARETTTTTYDVMDRPLTVVDAAPDATWGTISKTVAHQYDAGGLDTLLTRSASPDLAGVGTLKEYYKYDGLGRRIATIDSSNALPIAYVYYDLAGNVDSTLSRQRRRVRYTYDALNRMTSRSVPSGLYGSSNGTEVFAYDISGNLIRANNVAAEVGRSYAPSGLLLEDTLRIKGWDINAATMAHEYVLSTRYDLEGRRVTQYQPSALQPAGSQPYHWTYDPNLGALATVQDGAGHLWQYTYDKAGQLSSLIEPGGYTDTRSYDDDGRLIHRREAGATTLHDVLFTRNDRGQITNWSDVYNTDGTFGFNNLGVGFKSYTYGNNDTQEWLYSDALAHVWRTSRTVTEGEGYRKYTLNHVFAPASDRLTSSSGPIDRCCPKRSGSVSESFSYDSDGNMDNHSYSESTVPILGSTPETDSWWNLNTRYDELGRAVYAHLSSVKDRRTNYTYFTPAALEAPIGSESDYRYDALGRRVWQHVSRDGYCSAWQKTDTTDCFGYVARTIWDGEQVAYEIHASAAADTANWDRDDGYNTASYPSDLLGSVAYLHGVGIDQPLMITKGRAATWVSAVLHANERGLVDKSTDFSGQLSTCADMLSPCLDVVWPGSDPVSFYMYHPGPPHGQHAWYGDMVMNHQDASGLLYRRNRYFDPTSGRFTQTDPIGIGGGLNVYGFGGGDPVNFSDPFGLCPKLPDGSLDPKCQERAEKVQKLTEELRRRIRQRNAAVRSGGDDHSSTGHMKALDQTRDQLETALKNLSGCDDDDDFRGTKDAARETLRMPVQQGPGRYPTKGDIPPRGMPASQAAAWAAAGTIAYWIASEGSRILFPPRNLVPVP